MSPPTEENRTDQELVAALNGGDPTAFDGLYYRYRDWVGRLARRFTASDEDALDVLQETFAYVFRKFPGFRLTARMTTFLYPVVRNLSIAARKKRSRERSDEAVTDFAAVVPTDSANERAELTRVMSDLPPGQREVLLMRFVDDMTLEEIAEALDIPLGTVKSRLHNALAKLKADPRLKTYFQQK